MQVEEALSDEDITVNASGVRIKQSDEIHHQPHKKFKALIDTCCVIKLDFCFLFELTVMVV